MHSFVSSSIRSYLDYILFLSLKKKDYILFLQICVSSVDPEAFPAAVEAGAQMVRFTNRRP